MTPLQEAAIRSASAALTDALIDALSARQAPVGPPRLLSIADAARTLGLSRARLYAELSAGRLRSIRIGRRRLIPSEAIAEFIDAAG